MGSVILDMIVPFVSQVVKVTTVKILIHIIRTKLCFCLQDIIYNFSAHTVTSPVLKPYQDKNTDDQYQIYKILFYLYHVQIPG